MNAEYLIKFAKETIAKRPDLKDEIEGLLQLCQDEIDEGGSPTNERQLCYNSIEELLENQ